MSKKKKDLKRLEGKILSLFKNSPKTIFNYKQLASKLEIRDTKGRNNIISVLNLLNNKQIIVANQRGKYLYNKQKQKTEEASLRIIPTGKGVVNIVGYEEELIVPKNS